jgi:protein-S-isoprenylcysteine O-methyltransferase Ste14
MDETTEIDWLDRQLREAAPYLDDNGFTRGVLQKLPARRPRLQTIRATVLFVATLLASVAAYFLSDGGRFVVEGVTRMIGMSPLMVIGIGVMFSMLLMAGGVTAAVFKNREMRS